jgi:phospholipid/cholesterol/gamma-HCH transport system substrate-binding protein
VKIRYLATFVAFALIVAGAISYIASLGVTVGPPDHRAAMSMDVPDVNGVAVGSSVLLRGVPVGKVTGVDTTLAAATIQFYVDDRYPIPADSDVRLDNLSGLGETYIALLPRSAGGPVLRNGQRLAAKDIHAPTSISELSVNAEHVLGQLDPNLLSNLTDEADLALPTDDGILPTLSSAGQLLRTAVQGLNGRGAEVLANAQTLLRNAGFVGPAMAELSPYIGQIGQNWHDTLAHAYAIVLQSGAPESLKNVGSLLDRIQKFLDSRSADLKVFAEAMIPNIESIAAATMNFDTGQMLTNMLEAVPEDGRITLRLSIPQADGSLQPPG